MIKRLVSLFLLPFAAACATVPDAAAEAGFASERIGVEVRGSGPDVVLIPGLSSSPQAWESTVAAMPGYRYHLVHVAGFGGKAAGANAAGPVVAPVAEEIARYIETAGLERPALVGHSLGGTLAMMVAARHPQSVSRLMVVDMMPFIGAMFGGAGATARSVEPAAAQIRTAMATGQGDQRRQMTEQMIATMVKTPGLRAAPIADSMASEGAVSGQAMYDLITTDLRPELPAIKVPLTVLWVRAPGAPVTEAQMESFYAMSYANTPQAVLMRIPDSYHFIMLDAPEAFRRELRAFLAD